MELLTLWDLCTTIQSIDSAASTNQIQQSSPYLVGENSGRDCYMEAPEVAWKHQFVSA